MALISKQRAEDADKDAITLGKHVNGTVDDPPNINRAGNDVQNLAKLRQEALQAASDASNLQTYISFDSPSGKRMVDDVSQPWGTFGRVAKDDDPEKNGDYVMTSDGWRRSSIQPVNGQNFRVENADPLFQVLGSDGKSTLVQTRDGQVYIAGMGGKSLQETFDQKENLIRANKYQSDHQNSRRRAEINQLKSEVDQKVGERIDAPYVIKLSAAENAALQVYDLNGSVYLPGISGVPLDVRLDQLQRRMESQYQHGRMYHAYHDFGIPSDGRSTVHSQIQAAYDWLTDKGGGTIYFPQGRYRTARNVYVRPFVNVVGDGWGKTIFMPMGSTAPFYTDVPSPMCTNMFFQDIEIDGSLETPSNTFAKGFFIRRFQYMFFVRIWVHHTGGTGFGSDFADSSYILDCRANNCGNGGTPGVSGGRSGFGIGTGRLDFEPLILSRCFSYDNNNYGAFFEQQKNSFSTHMCKGVIVSQLVCRGNYRGFGDAGVDQLILSDSQLVYNAMDGFTADSGTLAPTEEDPRPRPGKNGIVTSCQISNNGAVGFRYDGTNLPSGGGGWQIQNSKIRYNGSDAMRFSAKEGSTTVNISVSNSDCGNNGGHAVNIDSGNWRDFDVFSLKSLHNNGSLLNMDGNVNGGRLFGSVARDSSSTPTQTMLVTGSGDVSNFDISENHYVGPNSNSAIDLPNADPVTVTYGRNPGAQ